MIGRMLSIIGAVVVLVGVYLLGGWLQGQPGLVVDTTSTTVAQQLRTMGTLETAAMSLTKLVEGKQAVADLIPGWSWDDKVADFLFGETVSMALQGTVIAGYEVQDLRPDAVVISDDRITITLPPAQILHVILEDETRVFDRDLGLLTKGDQTTETQLRNHGKAILQAAALSGDILVTAERGAQELLTRVLGLPTRIMRDSAIQIE